MSFIRRTLTLQIAQAASSFAQAIGGVFLARILAPERFGMYALAFSVAGIASIILASGAQDAMVPHVARAWAVGDRPGVRRAFGFWAKFVGVTLPIVALTLLVLPRLTAQAYGSSDIGQSGWYILVASFISTACFSFTGVALQVSGRISALAILTISDTVIRIGTAVLLAFMGFGVIGAALGHLIGALIIAGVAILIWRGLLTHEPLLPRGRELLSDAWRVPWRGLLGQSLWTTGDRGLAMLYGALPVALVGLFLVSSQVAFFKIAFGYVNLGFALLAPVSVLLNVEFPKLQVRDFNRLRSVFIRISLAGSGSAFLLTAGMAAVAPLVFRVLYGDQYLAAVPFVFGFIVLGAVYGLGIALGPMWRTLMLMHRSILINIVTLGIGIPAGVFLIARFGIWGGVTTVILWYAVSHGASFMYLVKQLRPSRKKL